MYPESSVDHNPTFLITITDYDNYYDTFVLIVFYSLSF